MPSVYTCLFILAVFWKDCGSLVNMNLPNTFSQGNRETFIETTHVLVIHFIPFSFSLIAFPLLDYSFSVSVSAC